MEYPIRILQVVTQMNRGGLENMIMNYYRKVDRTKVQFDFLTHRPSEEEKDFDKEIRKLGGVIYHLPALNPFSIKYLYALDYFFKNHCEYRIVHVHQDCMSGVILKVAKKNGMPVRIAHCHNSNQDKNFKYILKIIYKRNIQKYATKLFACGKTAGNWMFETADFEVLPNAIDANEFKYDYAKRENIRKVLQIGNAFTIGHVGRFDKVKNHSFLLAIFAEIIKVDPNAILMLVGDGDNRQMIEMIVKKKGLENNVMLLGLRKDVSILMQAMDVFVLPSLYEGLPVTMIEAQAAGLSCFISDKVPLDCRITPLVKQVSLRKGSSFWANEILSCKGRRRTNAYKQIVSANYDIEGNAKYLQDFYLSQVENT